MSISSSTSIVSASACSRLALTSERTPIRISFIIPAFNEEQLIASCIHSIRSLKLPPKISLSEIIVVDNQSSDHTAIVSRSLNARVVSCPPGHPSRARNVGARIAAGDWLAFVDADCCLTADWLVQSWQLVTDPTVLGTGGSIMPPENTNNWVVETLSEFVRPDSDSPPNKVRWLSTAGLLIKKDAFEHVGGFNEDLVSCEDCDLGYRVSEHGNLVFNPKARLIHFGESTSLRELFRREAWRSRGNLNLAFSRPGDLKNWISLMVPVAFLLSPPIGIAGWITSVLVGWPAWPWMSLTLLSVSMPLAILIRKSLLASGPKTLARRLLVISTFLVGRAIGLALSCRRVER